MIAIPDSVINAISIPYFTLLIYLVAAGFAGMLAALLPAFRAGRLNILDAISHE